MRGAKDLPAIGGRSRVFPDGRLSFLFRFGKSLLIRVAEFKEGFDNAHVFGGGARQHTP